MRLVKYKDKGDSVILLQSYLLSLGYITDLDGIFGDNTLKSVNNYQSDNNLPTTNQIDLDEIKIDKHYLTLIREEYNEDCTIGSLYLDNEFICNTLEDKVRDLSKEKKIKNETAIPAGVYDVILNYSPRFKGIYPRLLNVPYFTGILIHKGNSAEDSSGCILVGTKNGKRLINSKIAFDELYNRLTKCQSIKIEIK